MQQGMGAGARSTMGGPPARSTPGTRPRLAPVTVEEIVATDVVTAERDAPITDVVAAMEQNDVGSVVIVDEDRPVGILTDRTIALSIESAPDVSDHTAGDLVSGDLITATTETSVFDALRTLADAEIRRLPIVDEDGRLEGIVTLDDVLVLLGEELSNATAIIEAQSPRL